VKQRYARTSARRAAGTVRSAAHRGRCARNAPCRKAPPAAAVRCGMRRHAAGTAADRALITRSAISRLWWLVRCAIRRKAKAITDLRGIP